MSGNLFSYLPQQLPEELIENLVTAKPVRIERIVSKGHRSDHGFWYDQDQNEFVVLLSGAAKLTIEGEPQKRVMNPGDWLLIPAHQRHRVDWTTPDEESVWLAVHF